MDVVFSLLAEAEGLGKEAELFKEAGHFQDAYFSAYSSCHLYMHAVNECQDEEMAQLRARIRELAKSSLLNCEALRLQALGVGSGFISPKETNAPDQELTPLEDETSMSNKEKESLQLQNWLRKKVKKSVGGPGFSGVIGLQHLKRLLETSLLISTDQEWSQVLEQHGMKVHGRHVLLFGLPGTGKSLIVRAFHEQAVGMNLLELSVTDVTSRYYGDGEAALNAAFMVAEENSPCILFLDELDGIFGSTGKSTANSGIINQFLTLSEKCKGVTIFAATNKPWQLEPAFLRRFHFMVNVPLPNLEERIRIIGLHLKKVSSTMPQEHLESIARASKGMSGSDIRKMVDYSIEEPLRRIQAAKYFKKVFIDGQLFWTCCEENDPEAERKNYKEIPAPSLHFDSITLDDFERAMQRVKKTTDVQKDLKDEDSLLRKTLEFLHAKGQCGRSGVPKLRIVKPKQSKSDVNVHCNRQERGPFRGLNVIQFKNEVTAYMVKEASTQTEALVMEHEDHAQLLRLQWEEAERKKKEEQQREAIEKEKQKLLEKKKERERQLEIERQQILQRKEDERKRKEEEEKKKIERKRKKKAQAANLPSRMLADPTTVSHDHDYGSRSKETEKVQEVPSSSAHRAIDESRGPDLLQQSSLTSEDTQARKQKDADVILDQEPRWTSDFSETEIKKRFHEAKTLEDLSRCSNCFEYHEQVGHFLCKPCKKVWGGKVGLVSCPPSDPAAPDSVQKAKFRDLKRTMLNHLNNSAKHQSAVKELEANGRPTEGEDKNYEAGLAIGRAAYGGIKKGESYADFETDITMKNADLKRMGRSIGDINHSASFASSLTPSFHDELKERIKGKLHKPLPGTGEPPPFAIICDKMTPAKTTLHNIGIISPVDDGKLHATYLQAMPSYDASGSGSAQEVKDAVSHFYPPELIKSRFVGAAVDGAYVKNNFKEHLLDKLDIKEEDQDAYTENWDPAHIIECAGKDSRKQKGKNQIIGVKWIKNVHDTVNAVENKQSHGKSWQNLQDNRIMTSSVQGSTGVDDISPENVTVESSVHHPDKGPVETLVHHPDEFQVDGVLRDANEVPTEGMVRKPKKLKKFSTTRFTTHASEALAAFRNDWGDMHDCMKHSKDEKLAQIKDPEFILGLCGMEDVYNVIGEASRKVQSSRLYPWNVTEALEKCVDDLERMGDCLKRGNHDGFNSETKLKNFGEAVEELSLKGTYQGRELNTSATDEDRPLFFEQEISKMRCQVAENISEFTKSLTSRMSDAAQRSNQLSREVFALQRIENRGGDEIPSALRELTALQQSAGFISKAVEYSQVEQEYRSFLDVVQKEARKPYKHGGDYISKEEKIYSGLFMSAEKTKDSRNVVRMLANTSCQTHCEAITEGWGSTLGDTVKAKVNLDHTKLSQEVFIKLNGPAPFEKSDRIIEGALDRRFGSRHRWRFFKTTKNTKGYGISKVVGRMSNTKEGFPLD